MPTDGPIDFSAERALHTDFVGRNDLVAELDELFLRDTRWVVVTGGPGVGKSALLCHYLERLENAGRSGLLFRLKALAHHEHESSGLKALSHTLHTHHDHDGRRIVPHHFVRYLHQNWSSLATIQQSLVAQLEGIFSCRPTAFPKTDEHYLKSLLDQISTEILVPSKKLLILVLDEIDEIEQSDLVNPLQRLLPSLPKNVSVLCSSRPFYNDFGWIQSSGSFVQIDLDNAAASNEATCRAYLEEKRSSLPDVFPEERALQSCQGNARYLQDLVAAFNAESGVSVDEVPVGFVAFMEHTWRYLNRLPPVQIDLVKHGLHVLCASDDALSLTAVREAAEWSAEFGETFLHLARPFLRKIPGPSEPTYRVFHPAFRDYLREKLQVEGIGVSPVHANIRVERARGPVKNRYAVLVGVNQYLESVPLKYCVNDVVALEATLKSRGCAVVTFHDQQTDPALLPTASNIVAKFDAMKAALDPDDLLFVLFSCHGILRDDAPFLLASDSRASTIEKTGLAVNAVLDHMIQTRASRLCLVLDACHSGVEIKDLSPPDEIKIVPTDRAGITPAFVRSYAFELGEGVGILTGSTARQSANDWDDKQRSVFSYFVNDALSGAADADAKGFVTFSDLNRHTFDGVKQWSYKNFTGGESQDVTARFAGVGDLKLVEIKK